MYQTKKDTDTKRNDSKITFILLHSATFHDAAKIDGPRQTCF